MFSLREKPSNLILLLAYIFILNGCAVTEVAVNLAKGGKVQSNEENITENRKTNGLEDKWTQTSKKSSIVSKNNLALPLTKNYKLLLSHIIRSVNLMRLMETGIILNVT